MLDDLLESNRRYAARFQGAGLAPRAARGLAIVTCMDTRIEPLAIFDLHRGDAKILRNAGGRVTPDVLRSLVLGVATLGVETIVIMHHTQCALAGRTEEELRAAVVSSSPGTSEGVPPGAPVMSDDIGVALQSLEFLAMPDPDAALAADVGAVHEAVVLPAGVVVEGWRYDVETGLVTRVIAAPR